MGRRNERTCVAEDMDQYPRSTAMSKPVIVPRIAKTSTLAEGKRQCDHMMREGFVWLTPYSSVTAPCCQSWSSSPSASGPPAKTVGGRVWRPPWSSYAAAARTAASMTETLARLEDQLTGASLTERREAFLQSLGKGSLVFLPRYRQRVIVHKLDHDRRMLVARMGSMKVKVSFDEVTPYESL